MLTEFDPNQTGDRQATGLTLAGGGLLIWGVVSETQLGLEGWHLVALLLLVVAGTAWLAWTAGRYRPLPRLTVVSLVAMALAGGALTAFAVCALAFIGAATLSAALRWRLREVWLIAAAGCLASLVATAAIGEKLWVVVGGAAVTLAGASLGIGRRHAVLNATQGALVELATARGDAEQARADAEQARAELLAARNHLARELHDVLAHTLSALSLQLEALDSTMGDRGGPQVQAQLEATKRLVHEGLDEARGAVRALRDDADPLEDQLAKLAGERHAILRVEGLPRSVSPDVSLALFRVAQEALTNVVKHAPGAATEVTLGFAESALTLSVENGPTRNGTAGNGLDHRLPARGAAGSEGSPPPGLARSGGGYGLQGIRERVLLIGGQVEAGPKGGGWLVWAEVPT